LALPLTVPSGFIPGGDPNGAMVLNYVSRKTLEELSAKGRDFCVISFFLLPLYVKCMSPLNE
jgi:hypothetical protein